jgi:hypothetical protein
MFAEIPNGKKEIKNLIYNHNLFTSDEILNQIPLSYIISYVRKKIFGKFKIK